jgi:hypothetical protein
LKLETAKIAQDASQDRPSVKVADFETDAMAAGEKCVEMACRRCFNPVALAGKPAFSILGLPFAFKTRWPAFCAVVWYWQVQFQFPQSVTNLLCSMTGLAAFLGIGRRRQAAGFAFA